MGCLIVLNPQLASVDNFLPVVLLAGRSTVLVNVLPRENMAVPLNPKPMADISEWEIIPLISVAPKFNWHIRN